MVGGVLSERVSSARWVLSIGPILGLVGMSFLIRRPNPRSDRHGKRGDREPLPAVAPFDLGGFPLLNVDAYVLCYRLELLHGLADACASRFIPVVIKLAKVGFELCYEVP